MKKGRSANGGFEARAFDAEGGAFTKILGELGLPHEMTGSLGVGIVHKATIEVEGWKWPGDDPTGPYNEVVIENDRQRPGGGERARLQLRPRWPQNY